MCTRGLVYFLVQQYSYPKFFRINLMTLLAVLVVLSAMSFFFFFFFGVIFSVTLILFIITINLIE